MIMELKMQNLAWINLFIAGMNRYSIATQILALQSGKHAAFNAATCFSLIATGFSTRMVISCWPHLSNWGVCIKFGLAITSKSISWTCCRSSFSSFNMSGLVMSDELLLIMANAVSMLDWFGSQRKSIDSESWYFKMYETCSWPCDDTIMQYLVSVMSHQGWKCQRL